MPRNLRTPVADLGSAVSSIKYGAPESDDSEIGPLITARHRERVAGSWSAHCPRSTWNW